MKRLELNTDDESLSEIFSNGKEYYIPKFQRDYSWEKEHLEILWEDLMALVEGEEEYHYMGYLVIQPPFEEDNLAPTKTNASKVIDGQQRLTTFSLIILSAIKRLREIEGEQERIDELFKNFIKSKDLEFLREKNKLTLNRNNDYYYRQAVEGIDLPKRGKKRTIHLMEKAIEYYYSQFKKIESGKEIGKMIQSISSKLLFTTIYIGSELNAYKVFETLNARGVQLSSGDLLKNYLFSIIDENSNMPDEVLDKLDEKWEKIGENIGDENYTNFILSEWNSRNKLVRKAELFSNIRNNITTYEDAKQYLNELEKKSFCYEGLLNSESEFWKDHPNYQSIKKNLAFLKLFNIHQPISLLLSVFNKMPEKFHTVLEWIKVFSIRYNIICREHTGEQEIFYNKIALEVNDGSDLNTIKQKLLELYPIDKKFKESFEEKTLPTEQSNKKARYLLARLEEKINNSGIDETSYTIEHILPLNPQDDWIDYFGTNWKTFNQRIGNMALVTTPENKKLGQKPFLEKKAILLKTTLEINKNIEGFEEWNEDTISSRQAHLAKIACDLWRIE